MSPVMAVTHICMFLAIVGLLLVWWTLWTLLLVVPVIAWSVFMTAVLIRGRQ